MFTLEIVLGKNESWTDWGWLITRWIIVFESNVKTPAFEQELLGNDFYENSWCGFFALYILYDF